MLQRDVKAREGFELEIDKFEFPDEFEKLSREGQRAAAVCDMFVNGGHSIMAIMRILQEDYGSVVRTLIAECVVRDRRKCSRASEFAPMHEALIHEGLPKI